MKVFNKYIAAALSVCLLICGTTAFAGAVAESEQAGEILSALQIWDAEKISETVTRGEMADILVRILGFEESLPQIQSEIFFDVPQEHRLFRQIGILCDLGVISRNTYFYPDHPITYAETLKMLLCTMGYRRYAEGNGGYPAGYILTAQECKLIPAGVRAASDSYLSKAQAAAILENALERGIMEPEQYGDKISYILDTDITLLSRYHSIYIKEGILRSIGSKVMDDVAEVRANQIMIDSEVIDMPEGTACVAQWLGYRVKAYYRETNGDTELCYLQPYKNRVAEIKHENYSSLESGRLRYYDKSGKERYISIPDSAEILWNDMGIYSLEKEMIEKADQIVLIDNNNNGSYDVIKIFSYEIAVVSGVDYAQNTVYFKYPLSDGSTSLYLESDTGRKVILQDDMAEPIEITAVQKNAIISILRDKSEKNIQVIVSNDAVSGTLRRIDSRNKDVTVFVDEESYRYSTNAASQEYFEKLSPGSQYVFYLDHLGRIAEVLPGESKSTQYGYLVDAAIDGVFGDRVLLFMYLPGAGGLQEIRCAQRVEIDGVTLRESEKVIDALRINNYGADTVKVVPKPVKYAKNSDGEISALNTPRKGEAEADEAVEFVCYSGFNGGSYNTETHVFGGQVRVDAKTKIFCVPLKEEDYKDRTKYILKDFNYLRGRIYPSSKEKIEFFGMSKDMTAEVIVLHQENIGGTEIDQNTPITVVSDILQSVNADGEMVSRIEGWEKGAQVSVNASSDFDADLTKVYNGANGVVVKSKVRKGDIIRYRTNARGELEDYDKIFSLRDEDDPKYVLRGNEIGKIGVPDTHESLLAVSTGKYSQNGYNCNRIFSHNNENNYIFGAQLVGSFGKVKERVDNLLIITGVLPNGKVFQEFCDTAKMTILTLDEAKDEVYVSTVDEIKTLEDYDEAEASDVLFFSFSAKSSNLIIVKREV